MDVISGLVTEALLYSLHTEEISSSEKINYDNVSEVANFITFGVMGALAEAPKKEKVVRLIIYIEAIIFYKK